MHSLPSIGQKFSGIPLVLLLNFHYPEYIITVTRYDQSSEAVEAISAVYDQVACGMASVCAWPPLPQRQASGMWRHKRRCVVTR